MAMIEDLKKYPLGQIQNAFRVWRQTKAIIPTPADIIKIIESRTHEGRKNLKRFVDFNGDWPGYKKYLAENSLLSANLSEY